MSGSGLFQYPKMVRVQSSGIPYPSARLYFYETGTTTLKPVYTDEARTIAFTQPVQADAAGQFAPIFIDPTAVYKTTLNTLADVLIETLDPAYDGALNQAQLGLIFNPRTAAEIAAGVTPTIYVPSLHIDVERYGAVADDSTDNSAAFTRVTAVLNSKGGGTVLFPSDGIYRTSTTFSIPGAGCQYIGNGRWKTGIRWIGSAGSVFSMANTASANSYCRFQDFAILLANANDIGIDATSLGLSIFDNLRIWGGSSFATRRGTGIKVSASVSSAYSNLFFFLDIQFCTTGLLVTGAANEQVVLGGQISSNGIGISCDAVGGVADDISATLTRFENNGDAWNVVDFRNYASIKCRYEKNADGLRGLVIAGGLANSPPFSLVTNKYASYAGGNEIVTAGLVGTIEQVGENFGQYTSISGSGSKHLGLGTLVVGNTAATGGGTIQPEDSTGNAALNLSGQGNGAVKAQSGFVISLSTVTYSAAMTPNAIAGNHFIITATNGTAFTINSPSNLAAAQTGQRFTIEIRNTSGGALGAATWNAAYKMSAWTNPANGFSRSIDFLFDGTNLIQVSQTGVDVPN